MKKSTNRFDIAGNRPSLPMSAPPKQSRTEQAEMRKLQAESDLRALRSANTITTDKARMAAVRRHAAEEAEELGRIAKLK